MGKASLRIWRNFEKIVSHLAIGSEALWPHRYQMSIGVTGSGNLS